MRYFILISLCVWMTTRAYATPDLLNVPIGQAQINQQNLDTIINQTSNIAVLNWQNLDLAINERLIFQQPNQNSLAINRIVNTSFYSFVDGKIIANGSLMFINPNGIIFGQNSYIDVHNFLATTDDIFDSDVDDGNNTILFNIPTEFSRLIEMNGGIKVSDNGKIIISSDTINWNSTILGYKNNINLLNADDIFIDLSGGLGILNLTLSAGSVDILNTDTASNHGDIDMASGGNINIRNSRLNSGEGDINIQSGNDIYIEQSIIQSTGGIIELESLNNTYINDSIVASIGKNAEITISASQTLGSNNCVQTSIDGCFNGIEFQEDPIRINREKKRADAILLEANSINKILKNNFSISQNSIDEQNLLYEDGLDEEE
jgi:filamentous hemagglutinin family protein